LSTSIGRFFAYKQLHIKVVRLVGIGHTLHVGHDAFKVFVKFENNDK